MKTFKLLLVIALLSAISCKKDDSTDSSKIVVTGQFQKIVQGVNIWVETIDGVTTERNRYIMFVPDKQEITLEEMYATPDTDGNFEVKLKKGESYHVLIVYETDPSVEGHIKFNDSMGNNIIVPADAPNSFNLGKLYVTACYPWGVGGINVYLAENPLPWLTEVIDIADNTAPVISEVTSSVLETNYTDSEYGYKKTTYNANVTDIDGNKLYYNWLLNTSDSSASFLSFNPVIRTVGSEAAVWTKSESSHGTLTLIVTDEKGGSTKKEIAF